PQTGLGRVLIACGDTAWREADGQGTGPVLAAETWLQDVQLLVARGRGGDPGGPALAVKGGRNDEAHNHLDVGSYLVALDGAPVRDLDDDQLVAQPAGDPRASAGRGGAVPGRRGAARTAGDRHRRSPRPGTRLRAPPRAARGLPGRRRAAQLAAHRRPGPGRP